MEVLHNRLIAADTRHGELESGLNPVERTLHPGIMLSTYEASVRSLNRPRNYLNCKAATWFGMSSMFASDKDMPNKLSPCLACAAKNTIYIQ